MRVSWPLLACAGALAACQSAEVVEACPDLRSVNIGCEAVTEDWQEGVLIELTTRSYDGEGDMVGYTEDGDADGVTDRIYEATHDAWGGTAEIRWDMDADGSIDDAWSYERDPQGRARRRLETLDDGEPIAIESTWTYDGEDRVYYERVDLDTGQIYEWCTFETTHHSVGLTEEWRCYTDGAEDIEPDGFYRTTYDDCLNTLDEWQDPNGDGVYAHEYHYVRDEQGRRQSASLVVWRDHDEGTVEHHADAVYAYDADGRYAGYRWDYSVYYGAEREVTRIGSRSWSCPQEDTP